MTETKTHIDYAAVYFLSDVHLGVGDRDAERHKQQRLMRLFEEVRREKAVLYIIGDLFDFWYEYRHAVPRGFHNILSAIELTVKAGCPVTYLAGNHDFAIGSFFSEELGVSVVRDDLWVTCKGKTFYLYHGDGLAGKDTGYRILKAVLRNRLAQWAFRWLHPDIGIGIAHRTSHGSREYTKDKNFGETDGMLIEAKRRIGEGADFVIMGHRHIPRRIQLDGGVYVNLGDWMRHFSYAKFEDGELRLFTVQNDTPELLITES